MKKIFIIDNLSSIVEFYSDFLSLKGYKVAVATSVEDFKGRLNKFSPDLIIYDTDMPRQESNKFTSYILTFPDLVSTPILFLTGFINESKLKSFKEIGNSSFLGKDSSNSQVLNRVKRLMDSYTNSPDSQLAYSTHSVEQTAQLNH